MHWVPIPIAEFALSPTAEFDIRDEVVFRFLSRAPRRGFWISAIAFIGFLAIGIIGCGTGYTLAGVMFLVLGWAVGTGNILVRHKLNVAVWIIREPAAVYWAETRQWVQELIWTRRTNYSLTLHTPAPVRLEVLLTKDELMIVLLWLRRRNPDALIGSFSPSDSDGQLSGNDPWSPQNTSGTSADPNGGTP